jgi:hypothetical protein
MWEMQELSLQDDNIRNRLRTGIIAGKSIASILDEIGISENTFWVNYWRDTQGIRAFVVNAQNERLKQIARKNIDEIISMPNNDDDIRYLKIKADMTAFVAETLDKENFSKKTEDKGDERTPINIQVNTYKKIQNLKKRLAPPNKP